MLKKITETTKYMIMGYVFVVGSVVAYYSKLFINLGISDWYQLIYHPFPAPGDSFFPIAWLLADILLGASFFLLVLRLPSIEFPKYNYLLLLTVQKPILCRHSQCNFLLFAVHFR